MNSLPPFAANTNESDHPALESIAAYLDGRLPEAERSALTAHLDSCAACYEIYSESLRFQKEESAEARRGTLPFERRKSSWVSAPLFRSIALPLAALLLVGVGAAVWYQLHLPLKARSVESLTALLIKPNALMTEKLGPFDTNRGVPEPTVNYPVVAFQSGATLVDLRVAIEASDPEKIGQFAQSLNALYHDGALFPEEKEKKEVEEVVERFQGSEASSNEVRLDDLHSLETILRPDIADPLSPHFELGAWTEAGRLAVYGEKAAFFADPENRKSLRWFRRNPPKEEVKAALERIEDAWPEGPLTPPVSAELSRQFEQVIDPYNVSPTEE